MSAMVILLTGWLVMLIVIGICIGYFARWTTCIAIELQEEDYMRRVGASVAPSAMRRTTATFAALLLSLVFLVGGIALESIGIRPPGTQGFTIWAYVILVMPGMVIGSVWGSSLSVSKGPLEHQAMLRPSVRRTALAFALLAAFLSTGFTPKPQA